MHLLGSQGHDRKTKAERNNKLWEALSGRATRYEVLRNPTGAEPLFIISRTLEVH